VILSRSDLVELTGYQRPGRQIAWLKRHGLRFFVAADGHPRVLRADLERPENQRRNAPRLPVALKAV
jgi:hypothetical protein